MSEAMCVVRFKIAYDQPEARQHPGGEVERTGNYVRAEKTVTVAMPRDDTAFYMAAEESRIARIYKNTIFLSPPEIEEIERIYMAPRYRL